MKHQTEPYFLKDRTVYGPDKRVPWPLILPTWTIEACRGFSAVLAVLDDLGRCRGFVLTLEEDEP